ncbi:MAG TPA: amidase [Candidatus Dormibacteraeota bacterium]|nr:amidase [Candidatus Dormibacteraeota bacterium]
MTPAEARVRIRQRSGLNAFISLTDEDGQGPVVAVKDLVDVRGTVTTAGSRLLPAVPAEDDAPVIARMRQFGCVVIGKTNLHEWAFGLTSENPHYGPVRNPLDPSRVAGGSSGGSAAAVAAGLCDWALGTDTGGSIRVPAALCGVVGFKPTVGTVDTEGVVPLSRTLDTLGPLAPDVRGAARALEMMSELTGLVPERIPPRERLRIAVPEGWDDDLRPEIELAWRAASEGLPRIPLPERGRLVDCGRTILFAEAAAFHRRRLERHAEGFGADVLALLRQAQQVSREEYRAALLEQSRLRLEVEAAMQDWDALLLPATRGPAPRIGAAHDRGLLSDTTRPFNTTGQPVIALPAPLPDDAGLPVGVQVVGHFGEEGRLVQVALALEAAFAARRASAAGGETPIPHRPEQDRPPRSEAAQRPGSL